MNFIKENRGFISIPIIIAIVVGIFAAGTVGYVGITTYTEDKSVTEKELIQRIEELEKQVENASTSTVEVVTEEEEDTASATAPEPEPVSVEQQGVDPLLKVEICKAEKDSSYNGMIAAINVGIEGEIDQYRTYLLDNYYEISGIEPGSVSASTVTSFIASAVNSERQRLQNEAYVGIQSYVDKKYTECLSQ